MTSDMLTHLCTVVASRIVRVQMITGCIGPLASIFPGAVVCGTVSFIAGFIGSLFIAADSNQGPVLGIFITRPLRFVLGGIAGHKCGIPTFASRGIELRYESIDNCW
jgi:hypothetical protein